MDSLLVNIRLCSACSLSEGAANRISFLCPACCFQETCTKTFETCFPLSDLAEIVMIYVGREAEGLSACVICAMAQWWALGCGSASIPWEGYACPDAAL